MHDVTSEISQLITKLPVVIGLNGMDCAGKTTLAKMLFEALKGQGHYCNLLHIDNFNNHQLQDRVYRSYEKGIFTSALRDLYYDKSIDYPAVARAIVKSRGLYDVTIIEGVFLFKDELRALIDLKIFMPVDPVVARQRYIKRKAEVRDMRPAPVFDDIWLPAFERYCQDVQPENICDLIVS